MKRSQRIDVLHLSAVGLLWCAMLPSRGAEAAGATVFNPDPKHVWNRVYAALGLIDGKELLNPGALREESMKEMAAVLKEFVESGAKLEGQTPLQRAVMQRRLLTHFHAAASRQTGAAGGATKGVPEIMTLLARAARRVALTPDEIRNLPDNYATAMALPDIATVYDAAKPAAFLPKDLLADDGPWIGLRLTPHGGRQGVVAEFHFTLFRGNTSFEVRMRHPEGRAAGEAYLKALAEMPDPFVKEATPETARLRPNGPADAPPPNPATPQFPSGTAWALVHRAILADGAGQPVVSPLVESVQIRVYRAGSWEEVRQSGEFRKQVEALKAENKEVDSDILAVERYQTAFEWTTHGAELLENKRFHLAKANETLFGGDFTGPVTAICITCHSAPNIHSVNSRSGLFHSGRMKRPPEFEPASRAQIDAVTLEATRARTGWVELGKRWKDE